MHLLWLLKLMLAHLISDFMIQPAEWVRDRQLKHFRSIKLYIHSFITAIVALLFIGWHYWPFALLILISHFLIDAWKSFKPGGFRFFLIDQLLHAFIIILCWLCAFFSPAGIFKIVNLLGQNKVFWVILSSVVFLTIPCSIIIGEMTRKWSEQLPDNSGLLKAGKWIGILERLMILIFLIHGQYGAMGLLIAAKGLLRFNEKDRKEEKTEYLLIGSLLSLGVAIVTSVLVNKILANID